MVPFGFLLGSLRPIALGYLIALAIMVRPGYLPYPYLITVLPLAPRRSSRRRWCRRAGGMRPGAEDE